MTHRTIPDFWKQFERLPTRIQRLARKNFGLLKQDPRHPSLHFKQLQGGTEKIWAVRVGLDFRALGREHDETIYWFWIGPHDEYDRMIR